MTKTEKEKLFELCEDIRNSDEQTDALVRLFEEVKRMIEYDA